MASVSFMTHVSPLGGRLVLLAVLGAAVEGCGPPMVRYEMLPVSGVVTMEGQPLANADVILESEVGPRGFGVTDVSGKFTVATRQFGSGLPAGSYRVSIRGADTTRLGASGPRVVVPSMYREPGLGRVSIEAGMQPLTFDLQARPAKGGGATGERDGA